LPITRFGIIIIGIIQAESGGKTVLIALLSRFFIKDRENYTSPAVRKAYGSLCSILGIALNLLLFAGKYIAGTLSGSIAITADAFNNLSDAGSSAISLAGFALAGRKPDPDHPFGHGRIEYISGLAVAALILLMGFELLKSSVGKIITPEPVEAGWLPAIILIVSVCVKVYMSFYNKKYGKKISSSAMLATSADSLSDSVATTVVLLSMGISAVFDVNIDGYAGVFVALFILYAGYGVAKDTIAPLLGQAPEPEFVQQVEEIVMASPQVVGIHDLIVHDYGPGRQFISVHAEVPGEGDIFELHDEIDCIELELQKKLGCLATIHMDPVVTQDEAVSAKKAELKAALEGTEGLESIHDFRMVAGPTHTNLIFDAVMTAGCGISPEELRKTLCDRVRERMPACFAVIKVEQSYVKR